MNNILKIMFATPILVFSFGCGGGGGGNPDSSGDISGAGEESPDTPTEIYEPLKGPTAFFDRLYADEGVWRITATFQDANGLSLVFEDFHSITKTDSTIVRRQCYRDMQAPINVNDPESTIVSEFIGEYAPVGIENCDPENDFQYFQSNLGNFRIAAQCQAANHAINIVKLTQQNDQNIDFLQPTSDISITLSDREVNEFCYAADYNDFTQTYKLYMLADFSVDDDPIGQRLQIFFSSNAQTNPFNAQTNIEYTEDWGTVIVILLDGVIQFADLKRDGDFKPAFLRIDAYDAENLRGAFKLVPWDGSGEIDGAFNFNFD